MSLLLQAMTSDDDTEISECLALVLKASPLGLIHESINVNRIHDYTRSWFACTSIFHPIFVAITRNSREYRGKQRIRSNYHRSRRAETASDLWERS